MRPELDPLQIKRTLQEARQEIAKSLGLRDEVCIEQAADVLDQVQAAEARELAIRSLDRSSRQLRQIEEALRRLDAAEYGTCANCEEEIGLKRLRAVPWAQFCLECQETADLGENGDRAPEAAVEPLSIAA